MKGSCVYMAYDEGLAQRVRGRSLSVGAQGSGLRPVITSQISSNDYSIDDLPVPLGTVDFTIITAQQTHGAMNLWPREFTVMS